MEHSLCDGFEACLGHQFAKPSGGRVMYIPLDGGDANIINEPTPWAISVSVDNHQSPAWPQNAPHLGNRAILPRVMVEAVGTGHDVEGSGGEWQAFAVSLYG